MCRSKSDEEAEDTLVSLTVAISKLMLRDVTPVIYYL